MIEEYVAAQTKIREIIKVYTKLAWEHFKERGFRLNSSLDQCMVYIDPYENEIYACLYSYEPDDFSEDGVRKVNPNPPVLKDKITMDPAGNII